MNIEELGFTREELRDRVIDVIADRMLSSLESDEGGNEVLQASSLEKKLKELVKARIDERVTALADVHILPNVASFIENFKLTQTNEWGEPKAAEMSMTEYLVKRAEKYMVEMVDYNGKDKSQETYNFRGTQTRIAHMINAHLHYSIETAMKEALKVATGAVAKGIHETARIKLNEIAASMAVTVTVNK